MSAGVRFPGESTEYRAARDRLLEAEAELRRRTEAVAAMRRELPPGGPVSEDYDFEGTEGRNVLDATPEGRGTDWGPSLSYGASSISA